MLKLEVWWIGWEVYIHNQLQFNKGMLQRAPGPLLLLLFVASLPGWRHAPFRIVWCMQKNAWRHSLFTEWQSRDFPIKWTVWHCTVVRRYFIQICNLISTCFACFNTWCAYYLYTTIPPDDHAIIFYNLLFLCIIRSIAVLLSCGVKSFLRHDYSER